MKNMIRRIMGRLFGPGADRGAPPGPATGSAALICRETGVRKIVLHRHIRQTLGMTPAEYRRKWGLPPDYPMVSDAYVKRRDAARRKKNPA
ncbi:MucR family transcriptional regulator [Pseudooceanicola sp.]|uniref:MucR family transcriptional regulator n=1 Tax=Pseudooceanicola sp. TaxID=1914328 RepID=UPI004059A1E3